MRVGAPEPRRGWAGGCARVKWASALDSAVGWTWEWEWDNGNWKLEMNDCSCPNRFLDNGMWFQLPGAQNRHWWVVEAKRKGLCCVLVVLLKPFINPRLPGLPNWPFLVAEVRICSPCLSGFVRVIIQLRSGLIGNGVFNFFINHCKTIPILFYFYFWTFVTKVHGKKTFLFFIKAVENRKRFLMWCFCFGSYTQWNVW